MASMGSRLSKITWDLSTLPVFEKNFYIEHPAVTARTEEWASSWRQSNGIHVQGRGIPKPVLTFEEASMPEYVLKEVLGQGFKAPSPIQSQGWPMALLGRDMVGISATGSGKTLAFLLPAMIHINAQVHFFYFILSYLIFILLFLLLFLPLFLSLVCFMCLCLCEIALRCLHITSHGSRNSVIYIHNYCSVYWILYCVHIIVYIYSAHS